MTMVFKVLCAKCSELTARGVDMTQSPCTECEKSTHEARYSRRPKVERDEVAIFDEEYQFQAVHHR